MSLIEAAAAVASRVQIRAKTASLPLFRKGWPGHDDDDVRYNHHQPLSAIRRNRGSTELDCTLLLSSRQAGNWDSEDHTERLWRGQLPQWSLTNCDKELGTSTKSLGIEFVSLNWINFADNWVTCYNLVLQIFERSPQQILWIFPCPLRRLRPYFVVCGSGIKLAPSGKPRQVSVSLAGKATTINQRWFWDARTLYRQSVVKVPVSNHNHNK